MTPLTSILPFPYSYNEREKDQLKIVMCLYWQDLVLVLSFLLRLMWHLYFVQPHYQQAHLKDLTISMKAFPRICAFGWNRNLCLFPRVDICCTQEGSVGLHNCFMPGLQ